MQRALPALMAQATHDLNNHLTTIMGKAELALMAEDPQRWRRAFEEIQQASTRSQRLVADIQRLLVWSQPQHEAVALDDLLQVAVRMSARRVETHGLKLTAHCNAGISLHEGVAEATLACWFLLHHATEVPVRQQSWRLIGDRDRQAIALSLSTPGFEWDDDAARAAVRRARLDVDESGCALTQAAACAVALGAELTTAGETVHLLGWCP